DPIQLSQVCLRGLATNLRVGGELMKCSWLVSMGWVFILAVSLPAWGDDDSQKNLKSAEAKKALLEYDKATAKAREAYDKETDGARRKLLTDLEAAQEKAAKAKGLDEAVRIRDI